MKYTPEGLPVVSENQLAAYCNTLQRLSDRDGIDEYISELVGRIHDENPNVIAYVAAIKAQIPGNDALQELVTTAIAGLYELLKRQAEVNNLETQLKGKCKEPNL